ncbi:TPA: hypothetical protein QDB10_003065 [Burkholderia vietnamiensis]|nr:hypothetical protein [Burkholderia vietnamiensis]
MIDQDKMRALAKALREDLNVWSAGFEPDWGASAEPAAEAIDALLAEVEAGKQQIDALLATVAKCREKAFVEGYADSLLGAAVGSPDEVPAFVGQTVTELRAELEAAAADKRDGNRYRELLGLLLAGDIPMSESSVSLNVCGVPPNQEEFDEAVDFLLAQRQGEGS